MIPPSKFIGEEVRITMTSILILLTSVIYIQETGTNSLPTFG